MDNRRIFDGVKNIFHTVFHRQYKTGAQLAQIPPGVHQSRRVRHELQFGHCGIKRFGQVHNFLLGFAVSFLNTGYHRSDPVKHRFRRFASLPVFLFQIPFFQNHTGIGSQIGFRPGFRNSFNKTQFNPQLSSLFAAIILL
jgi:hypothetical protein